MLLKLCFVGIIDHLEKSDAKNYSGCMYAHGVCVPDCL